jgi:hypothetical protein
VAVGSGWTTALVIAVGAGGMLAAALSLASPPGEPEQADSVAPPTIASHRIFRIIGIPPRKQRHGFRVGLDIGLAADVEDM